MKVKDKDHPLGKVHISRFFNFLKNLFSNNNKRMRKCKIIYLLNLSTAQFHAVE